MSGDEPITQDWRPPPEFDGFRVLGEVGAGGMGRVYLGYETVLERRVALKFIASADPDTASRSRFLVEAQAIARLQHPNVVSIYRVGTVDGRPYIAYEFISGVSLAQLDVVNDWRRVAEIGLGIARGLAAAHRRGVMHRDIKPANVMLSDQGEVKLLDFGIAKLGPEQGRREEGSPVREAGESTRVGRLVGTPQYLAPELWSGSSATPRSDVYSLGLVLRELACKGITRAETMEDPGLETWTGPGTLRDALPDAPAAFVALVERCLEEDPEARHASAVEVRDALEELLRAERAAPAPFEPPVTRFVRNGGVTIAWQVFGDGPVDLVFVPGFISHLEVAWEDPSFASFMRRLGGIARVITFDKRGTGLSDRVTQHPSIAERMDDARAVMDAAGCERAVVFGVSEGACMAAVFGATWPQRTRALVLYGGGPAPGGDTPSVEENPVLAWAVREMQERWGEPLFVEQEAPSLAGNPAFRRWWARYMKMSASPATAIAMLTANFQIDIRGLLPSIRVPTLVLHRERDALMSVDGARLMAELIPGARFVALPGADHVPFAGDVDGLLAEIEGFLAGAREHAGKEPLFATVAFVMPRGPESPVFDRLRGEALARHGGTDLGAARGWCAMFNGPADAVRWARELVEAHGKAGGGVHVGEIELTGGNLDGPARTTARMLAEEAPDGKVLLSAAVRDLVRGEANVVEAAGAFLLK